MLRASSSLPLILRSHLHLGVYDSVLGVSSLKRCGSFEASTTRMRRLISCSTRKVRREVGGGEWEERRGQSQEKNGVVLSLADGGYPEGDITGDTTSVIPVSGGMSSTFTRDLPAHVNFQTRAPLRRREEGAVGEHQLGDSFFLRRPLKRVERRVPDGFHPSDKSPSSTLSEYSSEWEEMSYGAPTPVDQVTDEDILSPSAISQPAGVNEGVLQDAAEEDASCEVSLATKPLPSPEPIPSLQGTPPSSLSTPDILESLIYDTDFDTTDTLTHTDDVFHLRLLKDMTCAPTLDTAWAIYDYILSLSPGPSVPKPTYHYHLHNLARRIASTKPRTRSLFLRLHSVLTTIRKTGGEIHRMEWNALIDCAGKGWKKTRPQDYQNSLKIFDDMVEGSMPGSAYASLEVPPTPPPEQHTVHRVQPDIITHTTLLNIAARALNPDLLRSATSLFNSSGLEPNEITHLVLLRYYTRTRDLPGVRTILVRMRERGFPLRIDALNACIWAYGYNGRLETATMIYRALRYNLVRATAEPDPDIDKAVKHLDETEYIGISEDVVPDGVTYHILIQAYAYQGDLMRALETFQEMLTAQITEATEQRKDAVTDEPLTYQPTLPAFRSLFLGFARHARNPTQPSSKPIPENPFTGPLLAHRTDPRSPWNVSNLEAVFDSFLDLPGEYKKPNGRLVWWIMLAYAKASGNDVALIREAWLRMEDRFGMKFWSGRLERFRKTLFRSKE